MTSKCQTAALLYFISQLCTLFFLLMSFFYQFFYLIGYFNLKREGKNLGKVVCDVAFNKWGNMALENSSVPKIVSLYPLEAVWKISNLHTLTNLYTSVICGEIDHPSEM